MNKIDKEAEIRHLCKNHGNSEVIEAVSIKLTETERKVRGHHWEFLIQAGLSSSIH